MKKKNKTLAGLVGPQPQSATAFPCRMYLIFAETVEDLNSYNLFEEDCSTRKIEKNPPFSYILGIFLWNNACFRMKDNLN